MRVLQHQEDGRAVSSINPFDLGIHCTHLSWPQRSSQAQFRPQRISLARKLTFIGADSAASACATVAVSNLIVAPAFDPNSIGGRETRANFDFGVVCILTAATHVAVKSNGAAKTHFSGDNLFRSCYPFSNSINRIGYKKRKKLFHLSFRAP
jgi:hypothetical protein